MAYDYKSIYLDVLGWRNIFCYFLRFDNLENKSLRNDYDTENVTIMTHKV